MYLEENFNQAELQPGFSWHCEPVNWKIENGVLLVLPDAKTDFWQKTHYGFQVDNGHFLYVEIEEDFVLETEVTSDFVSQYDQAGLMVRISEGCWVKTAIEFEPDGLNNLGVVVTQNGYSDWSTQCVADSFKSVKFRIIREGGDFIVRYFDPQLSDWSQLRIFHLEEPSKVMAGVYCCCPKEKGFSASFNYMTIKQHGV